MDGHIVTYNVSETQQRTKKERKTLEKKLLHRDYGKRGNLCGMGELQMSQQAHTMKIQINVREVKKK